MDALQRTVVVEDTVRYQLFLAPPDGLKTDSEEALRRLSEKILAKFAPLLLQYIWQNQPFNLTFHPEKGAVMRETPVFTVHASLQTKPECLCWQEAFLLTSEAALSLERMWRMNGLLFTSSCKSQRLSRSWQPGGPKWA